MRRAFPYLRSTICRIVSMVESVRLASNELLAVEGRDCPALGHPGASRKLVLERGGPVRQFADRPPALRVLEFPLSKSQAVTTMQNERTTHPALAETLKATGLVCESSAHMLTGLQ